MLRKKVILTGCAVLRGCVSKIHRVGGWIGYVAIHRLCRLSVVNRQ